MKCSCQRSGPQLSQSPSYPSHLVLPAAHLTPLPHVGQSLRDLGCEASIQFEDSNSIQMSPELIAHFSLEASTRNLEANLSQQ